jgi:hypothetical protein
MNISGEVWRQILEAEDQGAETLRKAKQDEIRLIEQKRKEANDEVEKIRKRHTERLAEAKSQSDASVRALQEELQSGQQEKKAKAAEEVRSRKDAIVKLLLSAVLSVRLEKE